MAILIPGRIRNQGIQLYENQEVLIETSDEGLVTAIFAGPVRVSYDITKQVVTCDCELFSKKSYCQHLAAVEYYLKQDVEGKMMFERFDTSHHEEVVETSFGSLFLDNLMINDDDRLTYQLTAHGELSPYSSEFWWTLKIRRLPDERAYIIKDIRAFLKLVKQEGQYQIGKNYFERLSLIQFDQESQDLITFLWRLIPEGDRLDLSFLFPNHARHLHLSGGFFEEGVRLMMALTEFSFEHDLSYKELFFRPLSGDADLFYFTVQVHRHAIELIIDEKQFYPMFDFKYLLYKNVFYELTTKQAKMVKGLRTLPIEADLSKHVRFSLDDQPKLALSLLDFKSLGQVKAPAYYDIRDFEIGFSFDLAEDDRILLNLNFDYGTHIVRTREELNALPFTSHLKKEERLIKLLKQEGFRPDFSSERPALKDEELYTFFFKTLRRFKKLGKVTLSQKLLNLKQFQRPQIRIDQQGGLLEVNFDFSDLDKEDVAKALSALASQAPYFVSDKGKLIVFDDETIKVSQVLSYLRGDISDSGAWGISRLNSYQLMEKFGSLESVAFSDTCRQMAYDLSHPESFDIGDITITRPLRDYQLVGVKWLSMLDYYGFGGILADDMGLGKTLQSIAFLKGRITEQSKVLVLAPSSLIYNWQDEFHRFAPDIHVTVVYGHKDVREQLITTASTVLVTSYNAFRQDFDLYQQETYDYLILDEAQMIKNSQTQIAQKLREFNVKACFALSGTPIENHLMEIWSIFQIVLPGLLPHKKEFSSLEPQEVARLIRPFILRRRKEDVLPELPGLTETIYYNELDDEQKVLYIAQLEQMQEQLKGISDTEFSRHKLEVLSGITRLRQICDTPELFMTYHGDSGKLDSLRQLLLQLKESGRRALIFSQFKGMLELVEKSLSDIGLSSYVLTGSTSAIERQEMTRAFNKGSRDMFLISLKAGGVGLNLTGADAVILIDLWWNPAVEEQAISRAHRLGQKRHVDVYRLVTKGTIEEKMLALQESKKQLVSTVLDGRENAQSLSVDDLKDILGIL